MNITDINALELLDRITDAFYALDHQWNFTYINPEAARLVRRSREELLGKSIWDEFPEALGLDVYIQLHKAVQEQVPVKFEAYYPPLLTWFDVRCYPSTKGVTVYFQDVTEKKSDLSKYGQHYQSLFEHNPDAVYSLDLNGHYLAVNKSAQRIMGYTEQELLNASFVPFIAADDLERTLEHFSKAAAGKPQHYEAKAIHKDGRLLHLKVTNSPIIVDGIIVGVFGIAKDITEQKRVLQKWNEAEALNRLIAENSQDIITCTSPDGTLLYVSPAVRNLLGYEPAEMIGQPGFSFMHPEDTAMLAERESLWQSDEDLFAYRARHREGHYIWLETTIKLIRDGAGAVDQVLSITRDITERKRTEAELRKTKEMLESFIQNNADAIWVTDLNDIVLETNAAFDKMFQWNAREVIGKPFPIIPDLLKDSMKVVHDRVKSGQAAYHFETIRQRKDGSLVCVDVTMSPIRDAEGKIMGLSGLCRDISERKQAEIELKKTQEQLESFIHNHIDAIMIFDESGKVARVNEAFVSMFGWEPSEILGKPISELYHIPSELMEETLRQLQFLQTAGSFKGLETRRIRKDGTPLDVSLSAFTIKDASGQIRGWSVVLRDITEWKRAQELYQNSEKLNVAGQLAAGIAHEIRNPITAIKGFVQLMRSGTIEKQKYFEIMMSEIERIEVILSELLILAKPQMSKMEHKDLRLIVEQVTALLDTQAILNNVQIVVDCNAKQTELLCNENQMKQVFINYIKNALEAMPSGGKLMVQLANPSDDRVLIRFIDQGCGIPPHILSKLGQPFYTTKEKGTGLGFMVSKRIIENHQGLVTILSEENKGTTIEISLPLAIPG